jgi:hypothetical protein
MGLYDEVSIICPYCNQLFYWQSRAGECKLITYSLNDAPANIVEDLLGDIVWCNHCKKIISFRIRTETIITPRRME